MSLKKELNKKKFDKRIIGFNIQTGVVTESEYQNYLQSLKDDVDKSDTFGVEMESDISKDSSNEDVEESSDY